MLLSELEKEYSLNYDFNILSECAFDTLALAGAKTGTPFLTFIDTEKYIDSLSDEAVMVLTTDALADRIRETGRGVCITDNPRFRFFELHNALGNGSKYARENFENSMGDNCNISRNAAIADRNVIIGNGVTIEDFAVIKEHTVIGDDCVIRSGSVIGGEGFEKHKRYGDRILSVRHYGGTVIKRGVELQQNVCVDRALYPWDDTVIGEYTKVDNLVHIAHAVKLGKRVSIAASTFIAGRVETGDDVWIGPGVTISNGIRIGDNAKVSLGAVVTKDVEENVRVSGNFAVPHERFIKFIKELSREKV